MAGIDGAFLSHSALGRGVVENQIKVEDPSCICAAR
jgi:hypothetical protein